MNLIYEQRDRAFLRSARIVPPGEEQPIVRRYDPDYVEEMPYRNYNPIVKVIAMALLGMFCGLTFWAFGGLQ
jgi:hypothetical protein